MPNFIYFLLVGLIAGWLGGRIMRGAGFGIIGNLVVGVLGALLGGWLFGALGITMIGGLLGSILTATLGAVVLLFIVGLVSR